MSTPNPAITTDFVRFPPKWRHILLPQQPRAATTVGMTLYTASRPKPLLAQWTLWSLAAVGGARFVPGPRETWQPPTGPRVFAELWQDWSAVGGPPVGFAVYNRLQESRPGLALMVCGRDRAMLVRVRTDPSGLAFEEQVSAAAARAPASTFRVPRRLAGGERDGWHWVAYEAMSRCPHAAVRRVPAGMTDEIAALVASVLPRPDGTPAHWRASHGDLCAWNLRRAGRTRWLIDWEEAMWAPPGSDEVYFAAITSAMRHEPDAPLRVPPEHQEARHFWAERVGRRVGVATEEQLQRRLLVLLGSQASHPPAEGPHDHPAR